MMRRDRLGPISRSTRAFRREAQRTPGFSFLDWLHGYVYLRWPYFYIGIGTGEHWVARRLGPIFAVLSQLVPSRASKNADDGGWQRGLCRGETDAPALAAHAAPTFGLPADRHPGERSSSSLLPRARSVLAQCLAVQYMAVQCLVGLVHAILLLF